MTALCLFHFSPRAVGYAVPGALSLEQLEKEAEVIFKGEVVASEPVQDDWFKPVQGYGAVETRFKVISVIKGDQEGAEVRFRHYDETGPDRAFNYTPQFYHFDTGRSYIVFADKTDGATRQVIRAHTAKMDLGVLRCRDDRPVKAERVKEIYWDELMALRDSPAPADVIYAIQQGQQMSESADGRTTQDFSRLDVLVAFRGLISNAEPKVAQAAIKLVGEGSPYLSDETAPYWLGTVGVDTPGLAQMNRALRNAGGALCWRELAAVAKGNALPETRALAIRALGLVKAQELHGMLDEWLKAADAPVRGAAVLLFADFATEHEYTREQVAACAGDPAPEVRKSTAYAIGFSQLPLFVPVLSVLLHDSDQLVRRAARESLHSFAADIPAVKTALEADLDNPETHPLSLLALARNDPGAHLDALARVVREKPTPKNWTGGEIPDFTAWKLLFKYLRTRPVSEIRSGQWDRHLDALEQVGQYSSSEPRDLYAFYLQRGLQERATKYRGKAKKERTYDMDYYFDMVDKNPTMYEGP